MSRTMKRAVEEREGERGSERKSVATKCNELEDESNRFFSPSF